MTEQPISDFDRGHLAGEIATRLSGHDKHFGDINGQLATLADEIRQMRLAMQRLGDEATARDLMVVQVASALKDAEEARRSLDNQRWSPWSRGIALLGALSILVGLYFILRGP